MVNYCSFLILDIRGLKPKDNIEIAIQNTISRLPLYCRKSWVVISKSSSLDLISFLKENTFVKNQALDWIGYIHLDDNFAKNNAELSDPALKREDNVIAPWLQKFSQFKFPIETAKMTPEPIKNWVITGHLFEQLLDSYEEPNSPWLLMDVVKKLEKNKINFQWGVILNNTNNIEKSYLENLQTVKSKKVLALIPFYNCEPWLTRCLQSLVNQTYPLDNIAVIDDGSRLLPSEIVSQFPMVTLLHSDENVGPYRLIQSVIESTNYDYYMLQDADDWSTPRRLERLINFLIEMDLDMVGTQEICLQEDSGNLFTVNYPLNVNQALAHKPGHALLHATSLIKRSLVMKSNGFATGLRFGGDTEFLLRAVLIGKIMNIPDYCYFRNRRSNSLTTSPQTGLNSPVRNTLSNLIKKQAIANSRKLQDNLIPNLEPLSKAKKIVLTHICGPHLYENNQ